MDLGPENLPGVTRTKEPPEATISISSTQSDTDKLSLARFLFYLDDIVMS